jgi:putative GTP pyrophosphokinase
MPAAKKPSKVIDQLRSDYIASTPGAQKMLACLADQLSAILKSEGIPLGVSMEARIKSWESIHDKLNRKAIKLQTVTHLDDLIGVRLILLFKGDVERLDGIIKRRFDIVREEDTGTRLDATQFGYQSNHYIVKLPPEWLQVPSYADLGGFQAELQVRTLAQHIWAASSHELQYKREDSVPPPLRRTIHRVSALLETVDLEFSRVLAERSRYLDENNSVEGEDVPLDVDLLKNILDDLFPAINRKDNIEDFDSLLADIKKLEVNTTQQLRMIIKKHLHEVLASDKRAAAEYIKEGFFIDDNDKARAQKGAYYTFGGLTRSAMQFEFGKEVVSRKLFT